MHASNAAVSPLAASQIDGSLAQEVAGISVYAMWNESLYAEIGVYRSAKQGVTNTITGAAGPLDGTVSNVISGGAPYVRIAYEKQLGRHDLEIGVYGADFKLYPGGGSSSAPASLSGPVNQFDDVAEDLQYQFIGEEHLFTLAATHIHESMHLTASYDAAVSVNPADDLNTTRVHRDLLLPTQVRSDPDALLDQRKCRFRSVSGGSHTGRDHQCERQPGHPRLDRRGELSAVAQHQVVVAVHPLRPSSMAAAQTTTDLVATHRPTIRLICCCGWHFETVEGTS